MRLVDIMSEELVIAELTAGSRDDVLAELLERITHHAPTINSPQALRFLIERERIGSTGVSKGIAIPHARVPGLTELVACFGRSREGVAFGALDIPEPTVTLKPGEVPAIKFDMMTYDFGRIQAGGDVIHDFWFTNTGNGALELLRVKPG